MATTYYVATNGNDSWPGTEQQPFRTVQRGINAISAGDTVLIKNGTYVEEIDINKSGTASAPLTIKAYPDHKPVIDGRAAVDSINSGLPAGPIAGTNPHTGAGFKWTGLFDITGSHIVVDGLEITRSMGRGIRVFSTSAARVEHITLRNCNVNNSRATNVLFWGKNGGSTLTVGNVTVEGCDMSHAGNFFQGRRSKEVADWPACLSFISTENIVVRNNVIHENWGESIAVDGNDGGSRIATIEDNICYDNYSSLYLHAVSDVILQRNYVYRSSTDMASGNPFGPTAAIAVSAAEQTQYAQIPTRNIKILNNIVVGEGAGIDVRAAPSAEISNVLIAHNTVVNSSSVGIAASVVNKNNIVFRNNIVYSSIGTDLVYDGGQTQADWTFSNNMYSSRPTAINGPNDVIGDPLFKNATGFPAAGQGNPENYQILAGSPAIDAAYYVSEFKDDYFGNHRSETPDIGAHEQGDG